MISHSDHYKKGIHTGYGYLVYSGRMYEYANVYKRGELIVNAYHLSLTVL